MYNVVQALLSGDRISEEQCPWILAEASSSSSSFISKVELRIWFEREEKVDSRAH